MDSDFLYYPLMFVISLGSTHKNSVMPCLLHTVLFSNVQLLRCPAWSKPRWVVRRLFLAQFQKGKVKLSNYHCSSVVIKNLSLSIWMGIQWLSWCGLLTVLWPLEPSTLFIKGENDQGLLVIFAALSHCSPGTEDSALTGALAEGWLILKQWMDTLTVPTYCDTGIWTSWWLPSLLFFSDSPKALTSEDKSFTSHLPQAMCETLAPHSSATTRGRSSFRVELWPSWPDPPAPKVHTSPSLKRRNKQQDHCIIDNNQMVTTKNESQQDTLYGTWFKTSWFKHEEGSLCIKPDHTL